MRKIINKIYAFYCYCLTAIVLFYFVGFYQNILVPKQISSPEAENFNFENVCINLSLFLIFGLQHSIMARDWFKKRWESIVPKSLERLTYLLFSSFALALIIWFWQPINGVIWDIRGSALAIFIRGISFSGLLLVAISVFSLNAADFSGWQQLNKIKGNSSFQTPLFYKFVRHPIYLGFLISFWATSLLTVGHLLFAVLMTIYIYIGTIFEERNLVKIFGEDYRNYQKKVGMLFPR